MKRRSQAKSNSARAFFQRWLITNRAGRLTTFVIMTLAAVAIAVSTMSLAQTEKRIVRSEPAQRPASRIPVPGKSSPARTTSGKLKRGASRHAQQERNGALRSSQEGPQARTRADARPKEWRLRKARPFTGDLRQLPQTKPIKAERPEREAPEADPHDFVPPDGPPAPGAGEAPEPPAPIEGPLAPAPRFGQHDDEVRAAPPRAAAAVRERLPAR